MQPVVHITEVELERMEWTVQKAITLDMPQAMVELVLDISAKLLIMQLRTAIWAEHVGTHTVLYPADWWQAFKERWYPAWLKDRFPVRYLADSVDFKTLYPNYQPAVPDQDTKLMVSVLK